MNVNIVGARIPSKNPWPWKEENWEKEIVRRPPRDNDPCLHQSCPECHGSGRKSNGQICVHMISCRCFRCNPYYLAVSHG